MNGRKRIGLVMMMACCLWFCTACGQGTGDSSVKTLMETTGAEWPSKIERACSLQGLGTPLGTVKETYTAKKDTWQVRFSIDEEMTQVLVDGYAKAIWEACVEASGGRPHSCNHYIYSDFTEARRQQEPLDYYIWYYFVENQEYRVGIYPTMLEEGVPGGLILRIEAWRDAAE